MAATALPQSILIVGGGVFGLSTALALARRHSGKITLIESSPTIPNPHGSSVDASRIIRADYANSAYARFAATAIKQWQTTEWGHEGRYTRNGLVFVSSGGSEASEYVKRSYENVKALDKDGKAVKSLPTRKDVERVIPGYGIGNNIAGGYVNWDSGWGDAEASVRFAKKKVDETGRVEFKTGNVRRLLLTTGPHGKQKVAGVELSDSTTLTADLVILATGAWTGQLVDLRGHADATGQVVAFIQITDEEQSKLADMPTILNFSTGMFIIPPRNNLLKIARHAYGYRNPISIPDPSGNKRPIEASLPENGLPIPPEGEAACRAALLEILPAFANRPFVKTRICWYSDTPKGDFLVTHHPTYDSLFLATGGSGHAFKFLPVMGDKVVDALEGKLDPELKKPWSWQGSPRDVGEKGEIPVFWTEDGSRSGPKGLILKEELARKRSTHCKL